MPHTTIWSGRVLAEHGRETVDELLASEDNTQSASFISSYRPSLKANIEVKDANLRAILKSGGSADYTQYKD